MAVNETAARMEQDCNDMKEMFRQINSYFRDDAVLNGTEYARTEVGYVITFAYIFVILVGAIGNFLTVMVVVLNPAMRTTRNFFILNLALSDFFVCTVTAPMTFYTVMYSFWPFGTVPCKIAGSLQGFNLFLSTFSIAAIALDRYVLIIFPTKRTEQRNLSITFFIAIWIVSLVLAMPLLIASDLNVILNDENCGIRIQICQETNEIWQKMIMSKRAYTVSVLITQYAFPLCSIAFAYSSIAHRMKMRITNRSSSLANNMTTRARRQSAVDRQRRTHLLLLSVVVVFAVAWLPLNVFHLFNTFEWVSAFDVPVFACCHIAALSSACLNPLIYAFFNYNFRNEFIILFEKTGVSTVLKWMHINCSSKQKENSDRTSRADLAERLPVLKNGAKNITHNGMSGNGITAQQTELVHI